MILFHKRCRGCGNVGLTLHWLAGAVCDARGSGSKGGTSTLDVNLLVVEHHHRHIIIVLGRSHVLHLQLVQLSIIIVPLRSDPLINSLSAAELALPRPSPSKGQL